MQINQNKLLISYRPNNCSYNLKPIVVRQKNLTPIKVSSASQPVTGLFSLQWNGQELDKIPANVSEKELANYLQSLAGFGQSNVIRSKDCSGYKWRVKWVDGGNKDSIKVDSSSLLGESPKIKAITNQDGCVKFYPLADNFLRTYHTKPQIVVKVNQEAAKCNSDCSFEWVEELTPLVESIDTSDRKNVKLTGSGFDATDKLKNIISIGETKCIVTKATSTEINCTPENGPVGSYGFSVNVIGKGLAKMLAYTQYDYSFSGTNFSPLNGSTGGGSILSIDGNGFSSNTLVKIDGEQCDVKSVSYSSIHCIVPSNVSKIEARNYNNFY